MVRIGKYVGKFTPLFHNTVFAIFKPQSADEKEIDNSKIRHRVGETLSGQLRNIAKKKAGFLDFAKAKLSAKTGRPGIK
jgi:hypothetical protein